MSQSFRYSESLLYFNYYYRFPSDQARGVLNEVIACDGGNTGMHIMYLE